MSTFEEGLELSNVWYADGQEGYRVGYGGVSRINVTMEDGMMHQLPWAKVTFDDGRIVKLNLCLMQQVEVAIVAVVK